MVIVDNPRGDRPIPVPTQPNGDRYRFELIYDGGACRAYADTLTELIDALIPGYLEADRAEADRLRLAGAVRIQVEGQAALSAEANLEELSDDERAVLLGDRTTPPVVTRWDARVPLVLIDTYYEPFTRQACPEGNVLWLCPRDETTFLESLAAVGVVVLSERLS